MAVDDPVMPESQDSLYMTEGYEHTNGEKGWAHPIEKLDFLRNATISRVKNVIYHIIILP